MKKVMKTTGKVVFGILAAMLVGLGFIFFVPGYDLRLVRSESMEPTVNMGDVIITGPVKAIAEGQIVTFDLNGELVTHRIASIDGNAVKTKGDNVDNVDPWTITTADVVGNYLFRIPYVGYGMKFVQSRVGWFVTIIIPAMILVLWLAKDIVKEALKSDGPKDKSCKTGGDTIGIHEK
jgi:signal peptidase